MTRSGLPRSVLKAAVVDTPSEGLSPRALSSIAENLAVVIPDDPKQIDAKAEALLSFADGGDWGVAALVSSRTFTGGKRTGRPRKSGNDAGLSSYQAYADLGLRGLTDWRTVKFYAEVWEAQFPKPVPGEIVELPAGEFPKRAGSGTAQENNAGDNEWYTPAEFIQAAVATMGGVDLDPASTAEANEKVGAARFFTEAEDGLSQPWSGRVWMNPPYAQPLIGDFCAKLVESFSDGSVTQAITLTNNGTETAWFQDLAAAGAALCLPRGRVKFWHPRKEATPLQGQALVYLGPEPAKFDLEFERFGLTAVIV